MKTIRLAEAVSLLLASAMLCFAQAPDSPISRFLGTWTMNPVKTPQQASGGPGLKFQLGPNGVLQEERGSALAPLIEEIQFDGTPHEIDSGKATMTWKQTGPSQFEQQLFDHGQVLISTRRIRISNDGKTLTEESERHRPDATTNLVTVMYSRSSGEGAGLAGMWNVQSRSGSEPAQFTVSAAGGNRFTLLRRNGLTYSAALDDKPVPVTGPGVILGTTVALQQIDDHTIAETDGRNGVVTDKGTMALSPDGKVLTVTSTRMGPNASGSVVVYEKQ